MLYYMRGNPGIKIVSDPTSRQSPLADAGHLVRVGVEAHVVHYVPETIHQHGVQVALSGLEKQLISP